MPQNVNTHINDLQRKLYDLLERDPGEAIAAARDLVPGELVGEDLIENLKACVLVDAGKAGKDKEAVEEGVKIFRKIFYNDPERLDIRYNLANGLFGLSEMEDVSGGIWHLNTWEMRREARRLYEFTTRNSKDPNLSTQALTNIGNLLWRSHRWVEAYDSYIEALNYDQSNGIAAARAAQLLLYYADLGIGDPEVLKGVAARHIHIFKDSPENILKYGGRRALESLSKLLESEAAKKPDKDLTNLNPYESFVAKNRLALSATIEGLDRSVSYWDSLIISSVNKPVNIKSGVSPVIAMFNIMKADYLLARWLAYYAFNGKFPESGNYYDTLDDANYGMDSSLITVAQRACFDILDKVAIAAAEYFDIKHLPRSIHFGNIWHKSSRKTEVIFEWRPEILAEVEKGNSAIIALAELSEDLRGKGYLKVKKTLRNAATHRFVVLHKTSIEKNRKNKYIEHYTLSTIRRELISTLKMVRSALLYFVEMIAIHEVQNKD
ncbi:MAG: hypothetical protein JRD93_00375 [Deltaproteobacteria bacterium]|nr:hypothetical protein [Deltaproteobacteria bacterium]MBW2660460.1 hypothetical protein [Deltaproteobacteria bacterium]